MKDVFQFLDSVIGDYSPFSRSFKFALQTLGYASQANFAFFLTNTAQLADERRHFTLNAKEFALINPNMLTCPVFRSARDAEITKKIYAKVPILIREPVYGADGKITREELSYILDPATVMGQDYPSETFRVLKNTELRDHNEYRTGRLVLEAWDEDEEEVR
ncbi:MAG TPA: hypothetical protein VJ861_00425 [Treponemataceae bacterium]|nr:hypothetical protein [Treponemataceae bacterium]